MYKKIYEWDCFSGLVEVFGCFLVSWRLSLDIICLFFENIVLRFFMDVEWYFDKDFLWFFFVDDDILRCVFLNIIFCVVGFLLDICSGILCVLFFWLELFFLMFIEEC